MEGKLRKGGGEGEGRKHFFGQFVKADDSIKFRCMHSGMTSQVGGFQNRGVCLQAFPSFLPHPLPALLLTPLPSPLFYSPHFCAVSVSHS